jgi:IclR family transcriptional regulator, KDG regulon repressor
MDETSPASATSLVKALRVLLALADSAEGRGVTDIARALGLPKSAVHRVLVTFRAYGFVQQAPHHGRYTLGPTVARLGLRAADLFTPRLVARPYLEALAHDVGETIFLGVLAQDSVLVVDKVEHARVLRISPVLGMMLPLWQTALGKVLLAFCAPLEQERLLNHLQHDAASRCTEHQVLRLRQELAAIAHHGCAISQEEWTSGICCLAAPIHDSQKEVVAALAVAVPRSRLPLPPRHDPFAPGRPELLYPDLIPALLAAAARISAALP